MLYRLGPLWQVGCRSAARLVWSGVFSRAYAMPCQRCGGALFITCSCGRDEAVEGALFAVWSDMRGEEQAMPHRGLVRDPLLCCRRQGLRCQPRSRLRTRPPSSCPEAAPWFSAPPSHLQTSRYALCLRSVSLHQPCRLQPNWDAARPFTCRSRAPAVYFPLAPLVDGALRVDKYTIDDAQLIGIPPPCGSPLT